MARKRAAGGAADYTAGINVVTQVLILAAAAGLAAWVGYLLGASRRTLQLEGRLLAETGLRAAAEATAGQIEGLRAELAARAAELGAQRTELRALGESREHVQTELAARERALAEQRALLDSAQTQLADVFRALAADTLRANNQQFMD